MQENTNLTTLASGSTWTGEWTDCSGFSQIVTSFKANKNGSFWMEFSSDGVTTDRRIPSSGGYTLSAGWDSPQPLAQIRKYYRASYQNTTSDVSNLRIQTLLISHPRSF